jgi:hypothetical protein
MKEPSARTVLIFALAVLAVIFMATTGFTAEEIGKDGHFIAYGDETVLDTHTNLMWAAKDNGSDIDWVRAGNYCANYSGGGYTNWRLPTSDELAGLYDTTKTYKSGGKYEVHLTKLIHLTGTDAWSSETSGFDYVIYFSFILGKRFKYTPSGVNLFRALPVRSCK